MSNQEKINYMPIAMNKENSDSGHSSRTSSIGNNADRNLPNSNSSQALMNNTDTDSVLTTGTNNVVGGTLLISSSNSKQWFTVIVLCFVNLINYMDRFTIAGVLTDIQDEFVVGDDWGGLLQTVFVISYMIFAPLFGYLGDRYSRRIIMVIGVFLWCATTLMGSFMKNGTWFMVFRAFVGIGEASYSTIAPTIISDLFIHDMRSKMLALFYFAIPVGSGMGYIVGSETAKSFETWRAALRVTPILGAIAVILLLFIDEPERGKSEGAIIDSETNTPYKEDIKYLLRNRSFMLITMGFTCVAFVTGALAWFGPKFIHSGLLTQPGNKDITINDVSFIFGAITMVAGIIGVPLGSYLSTVLIKKCPTIDPIICAFGLLLSVPLLAAAMILVSKSAVTAYILIFFGELFLNMNWAIVCDMTLYVVVPTKRSTAEAFQILISHAFGDAGSPYLVGVISEAIKRSLRKSPSSGKLFTDLHKFQINPTSNLTTTTTMKPFEWLTTSTFGPPTYIPLLEDDSAEVQFQALQYSLFSTSFIEVLGAVLFLVAAFFIVRDKLKAEQSRELAGATNRNDRSSENENDP